MGAIKIKGNLKVKLKVNVKVGWKVKIKIEGVVKVKLKGRRMIKFFRYLFLCSFNSLIVRKLLKLKL